MYTLRRDGFFLLILINRMDWIYASYRLTVPEYESLVS
jgi:hypothetical protein